MIENSKITEQARTALKDNWINPMLIVVLYLLSASIFSWVSPYGAGLVWVFMGPVLTLGLVKFFLESIHTKEVQIERLFSQFNKFATAFTAYLLVVVAISLGTILFIVPGIILAIVLSQVFFIIADHSEVGTIEAIKLSVKMMQGKKWKYFALQMRFLAWFFVGVITLGIGFLWILPYYYMSLAVFYQELKAEYFGTTADSFSSDAV